MNDLEKEAAAIVETYNARMALYETPEWKHYERDVETLIQLFVEVGESGSIDDMMELERTVLERELKEYKDTKPVAAAIAEKLEFLSAMTSALALVRQTENYRKIATAYSRKDLDKNGLPRDAFRKSVAALIARYDEERGIYSLAPVERKEIEQRRLNLTVIEDLYKALQKQALA